MPRAPEKASVIDVRGWCKARVLRSAGHGPCWRQVYITRDYSRPALRALRSQAPCAAGLSVISVMHKPSASLRELAARSQGPRPSALRTPPLRGTVVRSLASAFQWRRAARSAEGGPAGAVPGLSRRLRATNRSGHPYLTPLRSASASAAPVPATPDAGRRPEKRRSPSRVVFPVRYSCPASAVSQPTPPLRGRVAVRGRKASAALQPCAATSPTRPLCARPGGALRSPALSRVRFPPVVVFRRSLASFAWVTRRGRGRLVVASDRAN